jgi:spore coat protein U-like protein
MRAGPHVAEPRVLRSPISRSELLHGVPVVKHNFRSIRAAAIVAALAISTALVPGAANAGSASTSMSVTSSVVAKCSVSAPTLAFGNWDVVTYGSAALNQSQTLTYTCTKGSTGVYVTADAGSNGSHASGTTRAMADGAGDYLSYELYTDSGYTTVWNTTNSGGHTFAPTFSSSHTATSTVYGQIPSGQDAVVGSYSDSVSVVINF